MPNDLRIQGKIIDYIRKHGSDTSFTNFFWKGCEPHPYEVRRYPLYCEALRRFGLDKSVTEISRELNLKISSARKWMKFEQKPKLAHYLGSYLRLGAPRAGWVWLSVNNTSGHAVPMGPFIEVPKAISSWSDVDRVLSQLAPLESIEPGFTRTYMFGFLIGMIIGDAAKSRSENWHRHIGLVLSKKYETNEKIGRYTCKCASSAGLRMHRVADLPRPTVKPHGFYEWVSQASPLVDWIFNIVLGLKDGERTTYDVVKMDWAFDSPEEFRRGLVQGIAESDGSVAIASQTVEFWIGPNWDFFKSILLTFGVRSFRNREALSVTKNQIANLGKIPPFAPHLNTVRCMRFEKLFKAQHIGHGKRIPIEIREFISGNHQNLSVPQMSEKVVDRFGVVLTFEAVQRWMKRSANRTFLSLRGQS
jgi:hypothetical protein